MFEVYQRYCLPYPPRGPRRRDRATKKLLNAQQELLVVTRKVEYLQARSRLQNDYAMADFTKNAVSGMVMLKLVTH